MLADYYIRCLQGSGDLSRARGQCRDDIPSGMFGRGGRQVRPGREIYRPPTASWNIDGNPEPLSHISSPLSLIQAQEFTPLSPAPLTSSRSLDLTGDLGGRRMEASPDIDISALGTFGPDMDEILFTWQVTFTYMTLNCASRYATVAPIGFFGQC